jgi:predicted metalloprotease
LCAHESGHALQKKYNQKKNFTLPDDPFRQVRYELCADFICGYYAQRRQSLDPKYPASIQAKTQFQLGDPALKSGGHGTAEQRGDAVRRGYLFGLKQPGDGEAAILEGVRYSLSLSL